MVEWLFWDNDGVLVETEHLYYQASAEILAEVGVELSPEDFREISLRRGQSVFSLAGNRLPPARIEELRLWRDRRYGELLAGGIDPAPGVGETLENLRGKVGMAVVTSCRRDHFEAMHRRTGLLDYFDFVLVREDYRCSKPHPEPYLAALERCARPAGVCLAVEDSERGVAAASAAGLACIAIPGPMNAGGDFRSARWQIEDIRTVPALIGRWTRQSSADGQAESTKKNLLKSKISS